jgi:hypothetical protein
VKRREEKKEGQRVLYSQKFAKQLKNFKRIAAYITSNCGEQGFHSMRKIIGTCHIYCGMPHPTCK